MRRTLVTKINNQFACLIDGCRTSKVRGRLINTDPHRSASNVRDDWLIVPVLPFSPTSSFYHPSFSLSPPFLMEKSCYLWSFECIGSKRLHFERWQKKEEKPVESNTERIDREKNTTYKKSFIYKPIFFFSFPSINIERGTSVHMSPCVQGKERDQQPVVERTLQLWGAITN
jgi:hypothetical protein